jgi:hypothetical protein
MLGPLIKRDSERFGVSMTDREALCMIEHSVRSRARLSAETFDFRP